MLTTAVIILAIDVAAIAAAVGIARADVPTTEHLWCDQPAVSACTWTVEIDGAEVDLPGCDYEDGNPDGRPCLWFDPDTGRAFYNDGANYRNDEADRPMS